jgi:hypothetical protein
VSGRPAQTGSPWVEVAVALLATYVLIWLSPVGHGDAIDRYGAQLFNRLAASRAYGPDGQGARADTQVVLLSDRDLKLGQRDAASQALLRCQVEFPDFRQACQAAAEI